MNIVADKDKITKIVRDAMPKKEGWRYNAGPSRDTLNLCRPEEARWLIFSAHHLASDYGKQHALPLPKIRDMDESGFRGVVESIYRQMEFEIEREIKNKNQKP